MILIRQTESHDLHSLYSELLDVERSLEKMTAELTVNVDQFDCRDEIEWTVKAIQV